MPPIPFPDFDMRLPPSGPTFEGVNDGDTFSWNATTQKWNIGPGGAGTVTEFDFLISTRDDLAAVVAPVGGVFSLPSGSYFFKEEVDLGAGETIEVDGETVFMMGGGPFGSLDRGFNGNAAVSSTPALRCINGANVELWNMRIGAVAISLHGILVEGSSIRLFNCDVPSSAGGSQPALELGLGSTCVARHCLFGGAVAGVEILDGSHTFIDCDMFAGVGGDGLNITMGAVSEEVHLIRCHLRGSAPGGQALDVDGPLLDLFLLDCILEGPQPSASTAVIGDLSSLQVVGGILFGTSGAAGDGIQFTGDILGGAQLIGMQGEFLDDFIIRTAGTQNRVVVAQCDTAGDVAVGVDWATANIPTNGLLEVGNQFNTLSPFQNHLATDARVNRKCNSLQGGLSTETAIVP